MNGKNGISIPWWVIIVALCVAAPVGVVLILLKVFLENGVKSSPRVSDTAADASPAATKTGRGAATQGREVPSTQPAKKKQKHPSKLLHVISIVHLAVAALLLCVGVGDGIAGNVAAMLESIGPALYFVFGGAACGIASAVLRRREQDTSRYLKIIGEKDSVSLMKLSDATSYRIGRVKRDVQRLIDSGLLGEEAYIDASNLCFMRYPDATPDGVAEAQSAFYKRTMSGVAEDLGAKQPETPAAAPDIGIEDYDAIIKKIRALDEAIRDEAVSARIRRIEFVTRNIFEYIARNPDKKNQIRMFMNYYLPTTLKLLESYSLIERVGVTGQNMRDAKNNIEKTLDTLVAGFEQQFDLLYRAESVDISSDIEVLEQMMARDGLKENKDFAPGPHTAPKEDPGFTDEISDDLTDGAVQR